MKNTIKNIDFKKRQQIETGRGMFFIYGDGECFQRVSNKGQVTGAVMCQNSLGVMGKQSGEFFVIATKL